MARRNRQESFSHLALFQVGRPSQNIGIEARAPANPKIPCSAFSSIAVEEKVTFPRSTMDVLELDDYSQKYSSQMSSANQSSGDDKVHQLHEVKKCFVRGSSLLRITTNAQNKERAMIRRPRMRADVILQ
jgi:hypothetical protein